MSLSREQRDFYRENGWLLVERAFSDAWLVRLRDAVDAIVDGTRSMAESSPAIRLWRGHSAEDPRLYDVSAPDDLQPAIWEFVASSVLADMACDLLGPTVQYRYAVLRFRELVPPDRWHQDMPFDTIEGEGLLAGVHLHDTGPVHPRLQLISGSHRGETFTHLDERGEFLGELNAEEMKRVPADVAIDLCAPAASIEFLDYRTLHQDMWGGRERGGALLYAAYAEADAVPIGEARYPEVSCCRRGAKLGDPGAA